MKDESRRRKDCQSEVESNQVRSTWIKSVVTRCVMRQNIMIQSLFQNNKSRQIIVRQKIEKEKCKTNKFRQNVAGHKGLKPQCPSRHWAQSCHWLASPRSASWPWPSGSEPEFLTGTGWILASWSRCDICSGFSFWRPPRWSFNILTMLSLMLNISATFLTQEV